MINKQILEQYAKIKQEIKLLEEKADELNPQILEMMQAEEDGDKDVTPSVYKLKEEVQKLKTRENR